MKIAALIPCFNEEKTLARTVHSCVEQSHPFDQIIIVNDGSTDDTESALWQLKELYPDIELVLLDKNSGNKSHAQEIGISYVTSDIFITVDADTVLALDYTELILNAFAENPHSVAISGYVESRKHNLLTACRAIDYFFVQQIIKRAQSILGFVYIIPGCAGAFHTEFFRTHITFTHDTVTEDLDFTYRIAHVGGSIVFCPEARVYTDDPRTLSCYAQQMRRWYRGTWQCFTKHLWNLFDRPLATLFVTLMMCEGVLFLVTLMITFFVDANYLTLFIMTYAIFAFVIGCIAAITTRRIDVLFAAPIYPFVQMINMLLFLEQGLRHSISRKNTISWHKPLRY